MYLTVNALVPGTHNREKATFRPSVTSILMWIDGPSLGAYHELDGTADPSTVIATSPGKMQVLWRVENFAKDEAEAVVRGMAARYGGDQAVWDCARILRLPGFRNCKPQYVKPFYTRILPGENTYRILRPADFPVFPELERQIAHAEVRKIAPKHHSRSEEDWARVLRKLAKGEDPRPSSGSKDGTTRPARNTTPPGPWTAPPPRQRHPLTLPESLATTMPTSSRCNRNYLRKGPGQLDSCSHPPTASLRFSQRQFERLREIDPFASVDSQSIVSLPDSVSAEYKGKLLPDLSVIVCDQYLWFGVGTDQSVMDTESGFSRTRGLHIP